MVAWQLLLGGIDGYYLKPNWQFAPLFGPTISKVRELTSDPIPDCRDSSGRLPRASRSRSPTRSWAFAHTGTGFVWFDATNSQGQGFDLNKAAFAAFGKGASSTYTRPGS